jgi:hypothetical protein
MSYWVLSDKITVINGGIVGRVLIVVLIVIEVISNRDRGVLLNGSREMEWKIRGPNGPYRYSLNPLKNRFRDNRFISRSPGKLISL